MSINFQNDWEDTLQKEFQQEYYQKLRRFLLHEYKTQTVYPDMYDIFNAFHFTAYSDTKVCIIGQDPYHGRGQAHGLSFSVKPEVAVPPSLQNIYKELHDDLGCAIPSHGYLKKWTDEGVLLLNAVLTVRAGQPASHRGMGWEQFTDHVIETLNRREDRSPQPGRDYQKRQPLRGTRGYYPQAPVGEPDSRIRQGILGRRGPYPHCQGRKPDPVH